LKRMQHVNVWIVADNVECGLLHNFVTCGEHTSVDYGATQWRVETTKVRIMAQLSGAQEPQEKRKRLINSLPHTRGIRHLSGSTSLYKLRENESKKGC